MRYTAVGVAMAVGVVALVVYAASDDPYYGGGVTRWEHADGAHALVVIALGAASALALGFVGLGLARRSVPLLPLLFFAVPAYLCALAFAWLVLSVGH